MFGCVVKVLDPSDPRYHSDKAKAAIEKELNALRERQVADFSKVREWSDVKAQGGDDEDMRQQGSRWCGALVLAALLLLSLGGRGPPVKPGALRTLKGV